MDCCSSFNTAPMALETDPEIERSASQLASLLAQVLEYLEFIRLAQLINLDPDVRRISLEIRKSQMDSGAEDGKSMGDLQAELESLPAVQVYRRAESAVKDLFHSIDQVISAAAGVEFAPNASHSGCG